MRREKLYNAFRDRLAMDSRCQSIDTVLLLDK